MEPFENDYEPEFEIESDESVEESDDNYDESMDGDHESALESVYGPEDYSSWEDQSQCEVGYDE